MGTYLIGGITFGIIALIILRSFNNWRNNRKKANDEGISCSGSCQDCPFAENYCKKNRSPEP